MTKNFGQSYARALVGIQAMEVQIEAHFQPGLPKFSIVGLPETVVKEARHRVKSAIINAGFSFPDRHIVVSLAPANFPKAGACFDLAIAIAILVASKQLASDNLLQYEFISELSLSGQLRAVPGILAMTYATTQSKRIVIVAEQNVEEALLVNNALVLSFKDLLSVVNFLNGQQQKEFAIAKSLPALAPQQLINHVFGQQLAKRALTIAAAGGHNLLMVGPPGCGKSLLASCLPSLLPPMSDTEAMEVAMIYSISHQGFKPENWGKRPFRAPHHSASMPALVGGGNPPKPGEISLAHDGVLFLDELPEYPRSVLEALREPLETGEILISRAHWQCPFPAKTQLIAAMNPCPCGFDGLDDGRCRCTQDQINKYQNKISGPLMDRIDLHIRVTPVDCGDLLKKKAETNIESNLSTNHIHETWQKQMARTQCQNNQLNTQQIQQWCPLNDSDRIWLAETLKQLKLSARSIHKILKVARTICDLDQLNCEHGLPRKSLIEALSYAYRRQ